MLSDQMIRQVVGAVEVGNVDFFLVNVKPADGTVVEHEPGVQSEGCLPPGKFEYGANQAHEKAAVTDKCQAML